MKTATWSFFDLATGLFTGARFTGTPDGLAAQIDAKPGTGAHEGAVDHLSQRRDMQTGELVDYKPDPPWDGTDLTLWVWYWDKEIKRWRLRARLKKLRLDKWAVVKAARETALDEPLATTFGTLDHDAPARAAIAIKAQASAAFAEAMQFTLADNTAAQLTPEQLAEAWRLSTAREQTLREWAQALRARIDACASQAEIDAIDVSPPAAKAA